MARILAVIDNPGLLVLDYVANVTPEGNTAFTQPISASFVWRTV